jgi:tetratricopeptide (TPR) repeat protein
LLAGKTIIDNSLSLRIHQRIIYILHRLFHSKKTAMKYAVFMAKKTNPREVVLVREEKVTIPTYLPLPPDKNPMFLEKRVYQGSSGSVYPLPFIDRIAEEPVPRQWRGVWIENEYLRALVLPEIGGRIHILQDKTNGYDLIYRQDVIKPALVGLAGPWISGGIEFNWPQHHRPATFLPTEIHIEEGDDGSKTIWCGDHDPLARMKAMHGVCLRPGIARLELRVRAYNRTQLPQTFLWWANVATRVHESYQSFFPPDVYYIADHAKRATSRYPLCEDHYYGLDYGDRARNGVPASEAPPQFAPPASGGLAPVSYAANDLSFYANIPVPTSYMCMGSQEDFFGGYDHRAQAGLIHLANHHISPGKKQWTWGNHSFGYAWDRNLTDKDANGECAPYIELMAGVYTDNQPDFSFIQTGETKTWTQYWAPLSKIGPAHHANTEAAVSLAVSSKEARLGVMVFATHPRAVITVTAKGKSLAKITKDLAPGSPLSKTLVLPARTAITDLRIVVRIAGGSDLITYQPAPRAEAEVPPAATEPAAPADIASNDELYLTGLHLAQYRHATRDADAYWREGIRRDAGDSRCHTALSGWHLRRGEFAVAETHARSAIARLTHRNPNPADGEPLYLLGLILTHQGRHNDAYPFFYKATWNQAWAGASYHALAEIDCRRSDWCAGLDHLDRSLRLDTDNLRARSLRVIVLRRLGRITEADALLSETLLLDPLDGWSRYLSGRADLGDAQARLDLAHDLARAGFYRDAIGILETSPEAAGDLPDQSWGSAPLVAYTLGWLYQQAGDQVKALAHFCRAAALSADYCFPARLEEIAILEAAMAANPRDARAPYYLGNLLYDRRRHAEAIRLWERAAKLDPKFPTTWRNLGIGYFNISKNPAKARAAYDRAFRSAPADARLLFELDQLRKRLGDAPAERLRLLAKHSDLVALRDDLTVELCTLYNQTGQAVKAQALLAGRHFQPWEGGEGQAMGQHVRSQLLLGREALARRDYPCALNHFEHALASPENLGEAKHLLANQSDILFWLGEARAAAGDRVGARAAWTATAKFKGDFQDMSVRAFSEMTYFSALAWERLGKMAKATSLLKDLLDYARDLEKQTAKIDYFATSLPTMLLFDADIQACQVTTARFLQAQALLGLGRKAKARDLLGDVLRRDPNHALASDLSHAF